MTDDYLPSDPANHGPNTSIEISREEFMTIATRWFMSIRAAEEMWDKLAILPDWDQKHETK
jgi:hypothetical protein